MDNIFNTKNIINNFIMREKNIPPKKPDSTPPNKPITPAKPDENPDPTKLKPGGNKPEKNDPTRIEEPQKLDPTRIDEPPLPKPGQPNPAPPQKNKNQISFKNTSLWL
jgi:hypothetical protein